MGDFGLYDEYTQGLLDTLERLGMYNSLLDSLQKMASVATGNFGAPTQMYMSPQSFQAMYSNTPNIFTTQDAIKHFEPSKVNWNTRDLLPAGLDTKSLEGVVSDSGLSKFKFLETLRRLELGPFDSWPWLYPHHVDAEL